MATVVTGTQWNKSHTDQKVIGIAGDGIPANTTLANGTKVKTYFREDTIHGKGVYPLRRKSAGTPPCTDRWFSASWEHNEMPRLDKGGSKQCIAVMLARLQCTIVEDGCA